MRGPRLPTCLGLALVTTALATAGTPAVASIPAPDEDPFYSLPERLRKPAKLARKPPGAILRSRPVEIRQRGLELPYDAWQLLYRTSDSKRRPVATVATLVVPRTRPEGPRPLVSYQMAIDSLGSHCQPAYTMRTGTQRELVAVQLLAERLGRGRPRLRGTTLRLRRRVDRRPRHA